MGMKWHRSIRRTGHSQNINLPNELARELGLSPGGIIQIEWREGEATICLRPMPRLSSPPKIPLAEQGKTALWRPNLRRRQYDNTESSPSAAGSKNA